VQDGRGAPIPNGRSQAVAAGLDTLAIVAAHRSLGDIPAPAGSRAARAHFASLSTAAQDLLAARSCVANLRGFAA